MLEEVHQIIGHSISAVILDNAHIIIIIIIIVLPIFAEENKKEGKIGFIKRIKFQI